MTGKKHRIGNSNRYFYEGTSAFVTTGTTLELDVPLRTITGFSLTPIGATAAANGQLSIDETVKSDGTIDTDAGNVTVNRIAGTDSGLKFSFVIFGY